MERIGERLRRRREELGLTLEDVSGSIRYRPEIISAIEEGRSGVFPAKAYLSAFLRAYAVILELDPQEIVREQKSEEERAFEAIRNIRVKPKRRRKFPRRVIYILVPIVLAVVLLFVVDRFLWERGEENVPEPEVRASRAVMSADTVRDDTTAASDGAAAGTEAEEEGEAGGDRSGMETQPIDPPETDEIEEGASVILPPSDETPPGYPTNENAPSAEGPATHDTGERDTGGAGEAGTGTDEVEEGAAGAADAASSDVPPEEESEPMVPLAGTEADPEPRPHKLVVSARRGAYISLTTGGRSLYDGYFGGGEVDSFYSETPFVIVALTDRGAWTFVQDGERVRLPGSSSEDVSNFAIPLPSGD